MNDTMRDSANQNDGREMARTALDQAEHLTLDNRDDRRVHGWATIGFGTLVAVFTGLNHYVGGDTLRQDLPMTAIYIVLLVAVAAWQSRTARTWPAGAKRLSAIGVLTSALVAFVGNMALNWKGQAGPVPVTWTLALVVVALLPCIVAGMRIMGARR